MSARSMFFLVLYSLYVLSYISCQDGEIKPKAFTEVDIDPNLGYDMNADVENLIEKCQEIATSAQNLQQGGISPAEDIETLYYDMIEILDELIEVCRNSNNAYKFLKAKGLDRIVDSGLKINFDELKTRVLLLLKALFDIAPTTTDAVIPITILDRLMDIFENDNLDLKTLSLEVLIYWLPDNPRIQARLMKIKGLLPFYEQIEMLDSDAMKMLLELFNKILKEHLIARNDSQRTLLDAEKLKFYQRIGLLEHMATPTVCNGLLNIFSNIWSYDSEDKYIMLTVFELLKNIKQYCLNIYSRQSKALQLVTALQKYVKGVENTKFFVRSGINMTDVSVVLEDYMEVLKHSVKEEL